MEKMKIEFKYTEHYARDNAARESAIKSIGGDGDIIAKFYWNKNHSNGSEFHHISTTGVIIITNVNTGLVCTKLIARPNQLTRYREMGMVNELNDKTRKMKNWIVPQWLIGLAAQHQKMGLNYT